MHPSDTQRVSELIKELSHLKNLARLVDAFARRGQAGNLVVLRIQEATQRSPVVSSVGDRS